MAPMRDIANFVDRRSPTWPALAAAAVFALTTLTLASTAVAAEQEDAADDEEETLVVTGTRLDRDPTARVLVISAEDIAALGLSSTEEVIRSLPHNFSTVNSFNNLDFGSDVLDVNLGALGLGISTANLRGLGSRNTLVLVNGRRIAGAAGNDQMFANVRQIPAGAIERVEVLLDGGGSVYGSDAIGGVINIVMKKDFTGAGVTARTEHSSTDGDKNRLSGQFGYSWPRGNVSLTMSRTDGQPVRYEKTGYTTRDYSPLFGGDQDYNFVGTSVPRSGVVSLSRWGGPGLILPPGNDGRNAQPEDFRPVGPGDYLDRVPRDAGGASEDLSYTLNFRQEILEKLALTAEVLRTKAESRRAITTFGFGSIQVPASNAFNNFGRPVFISYDAQEEARLGLVSPATQTDVTEQTRYVIGAEYSFGDRGRLDLTYNASTSEGTGVQWQFAPRTGQTIDDEAKDGLLADLLASSDPSEAVNFFGDGSGQNPTIGEFFVPIANSVEESFTESWELLTRFNAYELPGGWINLAAGIELREEAIEDLGSDFQEERGVGLPRPARDLTAMYVEALIPIFGKNNARPGLHSLSLKIAARSDEYETMGAVGDLERTDPAAEPLPNIVAAKFDNVAPEFGLFWQPAANWELRVKLSEGFRAPTFGQLFSRFLLDRQGTIFEPLTGGFVQGRLVFAPNPDLVPETSRTFNVGLRWTPEWGGGLLLSVDYSEVDIRDRIASSSELRGLLPVEIYANLPEFFTRAPDGTLLVARTTYVNISERVSETVDVHLSRPFETNFGRFVAELDYSRVLDQYDVPATGAPAAGFVGESVGVDRYRLNGKVTWVSGASSATLAASHKPGYVNNDFENNLFFSLPKMPVGSYTTVDASVKHSWKEKGWTVRVGGRNILDRKPPFMLSSRGVPYDTKRVDLRGRVLYLEVAYDMDMQR